MKPEIYVDTPQIQNFRTASVRRMLGDKLGFR